MEVKIGVQNAAREIVLETSLSPDEVAQQVSEALTSGGLLRLADDRGRTAIVPADRLAYVELGEPEVRRVGFAL